MVDSEFVAEDFEQFLEFVKDTFLGKYKFLEVGPSTIYAYILGTERIAYRENFAKEDGLKEKVTLLKQQGFISGYRKTIG